MTSSGSGGRAIPTLEEVAARAGVSRATASRVLRGATNVSERARTAVREAAESINYVPNLAARSLVTGRSDSIAFLVAETQDRLFSDPFFMGLLRGAQTVVAEAGLQLVFTVATTEHDFARFVQYASGGHVDGVLLLSLHGDTSLPVELEARGVPTLLAGRPQVAADELYYVDSDNRAGAQLATRRLLDSGHRRLATIHGPLDMSVGQDRLAGFEQAMAEAGRSWGEDLRAPGGFTAAGGYEAMTTLLERHPDVDAVFAASDLMALGAMRAIEYSGRRVGSDVAVIGFDDIADAALAHPPLTTVRQPVGRLGSTMSELLLKRIAGVAVEAATVLDVELVARSSG
ncbi:LacI family transcriptional regulator [Jatrophihabitans telluris]|uniref:LacI family transcriptional regulator n=1 Tax=Jatrophihabitans telluris TaxID=2038343 RepID=A0ABY4R3P2_9ACTN|nr:LacI family DNA-binding transcriptional regulator [Jatrophihabitans telluris]UQX89998.1 LacI family transcriptional regulator [Jatrophihabitans telluris]